MSQMGAHGVYVLRHFWSIMASAMRQRLKGVMSGRLGRQSTG